MVRDMECSGNNEFSGQMKTHFPLYANKHLSPIILGQFYAMTYKWEL